MKLSKAISVISEIFTCIVLATYIINEAPILKQQISDRYFSDEINEIYNLDDPSVLNI